MSDAARVLLDLPATRGRLHALAAAGVLDRAELELGLRELGLRPTAKSWATYLARHALLIGVVLLVVGTIFFVAANWSALPGLVRIGLIGGAMISATLVGGYLGETLTGRALGLLGGLLFGPLLAVYGQIYQTGADPWELFAWWTAVLIAYAALVRFVGIWVLALVCLHVAWFTWINQALGGPYYSGAGALAVAGLAALDGLLVALAERVVPAGRERRAITHVAAIFGLAVALPFGIFAIFGEAPRESLPGLIVLGSGLAAIFAIYRARRPEVGMLAMFAGVVTILISSFVGWQLMEMDTGLFGIAMLGVLVCAQVWGFTRWLASWRRDAGGAEGQS